MITRFVRIQPNVRLEIQAGLHVYITLHATLVERSTTLVVWNSERAVETIQNTPPEG